MSPSRNAPLTPPSEFRGVFRVDDLARAVYSESAAVARMMPRAVAVPQDVADVQTLVRWGTAQGVSLVPRGSGSSMAGGAVGAGVMVDLGRFDAIGEVDRATKTIRVGAAVLRDRVEAAANAAGLTFPVDPSSSAFATIGGMCATNAAGPSTVRYGAMRMWVRALDVVLSDGSLVHLVRGAPTDANPVLERFLDDVTPRLKDVWVGTLRHGAVRKDSSGYGLAAYMENDDLLDLFIGSEGTLGIIMAAELGLITKPAEPLGLVAAFGDIHDAVEVAGKLAAGGASAVELLDRTFLEIATRTGDPLPIAFPGTPDAVLIVEVDTEDALDAMATLCRNGSATYLHRATDPAARATLWQLRHAASPTLNKLAPRLQNLQLIEDGCVPPEHLGPYVLGVRQALEKARFLGVIFGHAGDGHAHVNALVDVREPDWRARAEQLMEQVATLVAQLGGTLAGEHGDGRLRAPLLAKVWHPRALELFKATKAALDPQEIFNPGVILAAEGARPLEDVKYDPALPPLPAAARAALDRVVREKAYATHRLALLEEARA